MVLAPQIFSMFNFEIENDLWGGGLILPSNQFMWNGDKIGPIEERARYVGAFAAEVSKSSYGKRYIKECLDRNG